MKVPPLSRNTGKANIAAILAKTKFTATHVVASSKCRVLMPTFWMTAQSKEGPKYGGPPVQKGRRVAERSCPASGCLVRSPLRATSMTRPHAEGVREHDSLNVFRHLEA
jgi:hypothetical protein